MVVIFGPNQCQVNGCTSIGDLIRDVHAQGMTFVQIRVCKEHDEEYERQFWARIRGEKAA